MTAIEPKSTITACPCCGGELGEPFYHMGPAPVHSCLMLQDPVAAAAFPTGHVRLAACRDCGFVANVAFDSKWSAYAPEYEDQQSFSPTFNSFAGGLARFLVEEYDLAGKSAVEIGCSKGDFLALLCEAGGMDVVGVDPSALPGRVASPSQGSMRLIQAYYGPEHLEHRADLLCCRHTLEHIQTVAEHLDLMRQHAERTPGAVLCIEVPDSTRLWRDGAFEDIYYEHCSYFTAGSLARAVRRAGFSVVDLRREYADQYLVIEATLDPAADRSFEIEESVDSNLADIERFSGVVDQAMQDWRERLLAAREAGERVAIWGSGSKCVAFLRTLRAEPLVDMIVDINPHRTGKVAPGLSRPISAPSELKALDPDLVVAMNAIYRDEIAADCAAMGLTAEIVALGA